MRKSTDSLHYGELIQLQTQNKNSGMPFEIRRDTDKSLQSSQADLTTLSQNNSAETLLQVQAENTFKPPRQSEDSQSDDNKSLAMSTTPLKTIKDVHAENNLKQQKQCKTSQEFMKMVMYSVPLNKLYKVLASCQYTENADFCPVLIRIQDETVKKISDGYQYLLQVWTKEGIMVFERALHKPISNWNISNDKFIFQEDKDSSEIFIVSLFMNKQPFLFKISLPEWDVTKDRINSYFDFDKQRFVTPAEQTSNLAFQSDIDDSNFQSGISSLNHSDAEEQNHKAQTQKHPISIKTKSERQYKYKIENNYEPEDDQESVSQLMKGAIIERAPDKMINYHQGFILLAYRNSIVYCNVSDYGIDKIKRIPQNLHQKGKNFVHVQILEEQLCHLDLDEKFKIVCIQEIGNDMSALVLEDVRTRQIRFLRLFYEELESEVKRSLKLVQLGVAVIQEEMEASPLLKYRSVAKTDPQTDKHSQLSMIVRENGRFEVYSDFVLVSNYYDKNYQCVDTETDFNQFFLKFVKKSQKVKETTKMEDLKFEIRQFRHFWKNRISFNTSTIKKNSERWKNIIHHRIAKHCRLYTQILIYSIYMLVSHRNMISVFAMTNLSGKDAKWIDTIKLKEGQVRQMFIEKRSKSVRAELIAKMALQQRPNLVFDEENQTQQTKGYKNAINIFQSSQVVCYVGIRTIKLLQLTAKGFFKRSKFLDQSIKFPGQILRFQIDDLYNSGSLFLTDDSYEGGDNEYSVFENSQLRIFPKPSKTMKQSQFPEMNKHNKTRNSKRVTLHSLKHGEVFPLLNSKTDACIDRDTYFKVMRANRSVFEAEDIQDIYHEKDQDQLSLDEVKKAFFNKNYVDVVVCYSHNGQKHSVYPLLKTRNDLKRITSMSLLTDEVYSKNIEVQPYDKESSIVHSFYSNSSEYGSNVDSYAQVSDKAVKIYDQSMQLRLKFNGLNIRNCIDLHQSYLYMISDNRNQPYSITDMKSDKGPQTQSEFRYQPSGLYVLDTQPLFEGRIEKYRLASAIGGVCNLMSVDKFSDRISFIQDYNKIAVIPFPHLNLINCVGMGQKHEYLIWREKNGFFTALDYKSNLLTWSILTGKLLYNESQVRKDGSAGEMDNYEVFLSDESDVNYTQDLYNLEDHSITLLKNKKPINVEYEVPVRNIQTQQNNSKTKQFYSAFKKLQTVNEAGLVNIDPKSHLLDDKLFVSQKEIQIQVRNSQQQADLYHFKVMQLRVHEDTKQNSQCKVSFHFSFPMIKPKMRKKLRSFDWDIASKPVQRIWLSKDTRLMMEVINDFIGTVYRRVNIDEHGIEIQTSDELQGDFGQAVEWVIDYQIKRFPKSLVDKTNVPYLFSPNFTYQFDFTYRTKQFLIRVTRTQEIYMYIPNDMVSMVEWDNAEGQGAIQIICSRTMWLGERRLRIINESNIDCLFDMCSTDTNDSSIDARYLKLVSSVKIDNEYENMRRRDSPHMIMQPNSLEHRDVLERLVRTSQDYKTSIQHAVNLGDQKFQLLSKINKIDYLQPWGLQESSFYIELSFTLLDFKIMEMIISDDVFTVKSADIEQALQLCFNIWPKGRGALHQLVVGSQRTKRRTNMEGDHIQAYWAAIDLFKIASQKIQMDITGDSHIEEGTSFEIPILPDMYGQTPLDMCLGINHQRADQKHVFSKRKIKKQKLSKATNEAMANIIFNNIKGYEYMHSSQIVHEAIIKATRLGLPSIGDYLESRMIKPRHCFESSTQYSIKKSCLNDTPSMGEYGLIHTQVWGSEKIIKDDLFETEGALHPMQLLYMDIPYLYKNTEYGMDFMYALAGTDPHDLSLFRLKSVQIIIDGHFQYWRKISKRAIGYPLILQMMLFWYWSNLLLPSELEDRLQTDTITLQTTICQVLMNVINFYLFLFEVPQIFRRKTKYIYSFEKIVNLVTPMLILYNTVKHNIEEASFWTIQSWSALALWLRLVLYLRISSKFNWLIRMMISCLIEMKMFMVVFGICMLAFADAFASIDRALFLNTALILSRTDDETTTTAALRFLKSGGGGSSAVLVEAEETIWSQYSNSVHNSFLVALGEFGTTGLKGYRLGDWIIFALCCLLNLTLMLNLLIAIIGATYANISEHDTEFNYKERAILVAGMQDTFNGIFKAQTDHNERLFVAKVINSDEINDEDDRDRIGEVMSEIQILHDQQQDLKNHFDKKFDQLACALSAKMEDKNGVSLKDYLKVTKLEQEMKRKDELTHLQAMQQDARDNKVDLMAAYVSSSKSKYPDIASIASQLQQQKNGSKKH